jgi:FkbM family methyltransferase
MNRVEVDGLIFDCRPDTSDEKAVREVVERKGYARRDFLPGPGERWLDIGCNVGAFAIWAASWGATVEAYEPDPDSCEQARHNVALNGMERYVTVHEAALVPGKEAGTMTLHRNTAKGNVWRNSLYKPWRGGSEVEVQCIPVSDVWDQAMHIKLDAEGAEMPILEQMMDSLPVRLVFEWSFDIDPSIKRFDSVIAGLQEKYDRVRYGKIAPGHDEWPGEWFPPCRTVWCD